MTVADATPFPLGFTLTVPAGERDTCTRVITNIAGNTLTLASAVTAAQRRTARQPRVRQRQPDAVRRVAGPDGGAGRRRS